MDRVFNAKVGTIPMRIRLLRKRTPPKVGDKVTFREATTSYGKPLTGIVRGVEPVLFVELM